MAERPYGIGVLSFVGCSELILQLYEFIDKCVIKTGARLRFHPAPDSTGIRVIARTELSIFLISAAGSALGFFYLLFGSYFMVNLHWIYLYYYKIDIIYIVYWQFLLKTAN
jgi:hypothetical protein